MMAIALNIVSAEALTSSTTVPRQRIGFVNAPLGSEPKQNLDKLARATNRRGADSEGLPTVSAHKFILNKAQ